MWSARVPETGPDASLSSGEMMQRQPGRKLCRSCICAPNLPSYPSPARLIHSLPGEVNHCMAGDKLVRLFLIVLDKADYSLIRVIVGGAVVTLQSQTFLCGRLLLQEEKSIPVVGWLVWRLAVKLHQAGVKRKGLYVWYTTASLHDITNNWRCVSLLLSLFLMCLSHTHSAMAATSPVYYTGSSIPINWEYFQSISSALFTRQVPSGFTQKTLISVYLSSTPWPSGRKTDCYYMTRFPLGTHDLLFLIHSQDFHLEHGLNSFFWLKNEHE